MTCCELTIVITSDDDDDFSLSCVSKHAIESVSILEFFDIQFSINGIIVALLERKREREKQTTS